MSGWIKCSERMPGEGKPVLTYDPSSYHAIQTHVWDYGMWLGANHGVITHWMPLPDPPKEEE